MHVTKAELTAMGVEDSQFPKDGLPEIVLSGRSNVGKSSFINSMVNRKKLAYTSSTPGKTQTLNFYNIDDRCYFVDVPGYGYAKVSKKQREEFGKMIEAYIETREQLRLAVLLVDFRHKPTEDDCLMYNFYKHFNIPVLVVGTKVDKIPKTRRHRNEKEIKNTLDFNSTDGFIKYSSETHQGKDQVWKYIHNFLKELK
ncbi:ribosome biogenesis GTP-binding protein YihA/YsxC [Haloplasma contractile]|uniref:Probable GTP-binding protein EngB n=1 Tax=Haloplasma contractile SSD-17B TaxID=1033810 RepID=U2DZD5_9MOLU|nr:ribosome biogenesis GTP-binding protein YihA/YsxC [Haloplasma contractile]ERJ13562.1 putative GTP-binding protein EngB [Haloplasma contractile SSD-17B]